MASSRFRFLASLLFFFIASHTAAHERHDHGDKPKPLNIVTAPRVVTSSTLFELVAISDGATLVMYLDRFDTNEPVVGAQIDVETPSGATKAAASGDTYTLDAP